MTGFYFSKKALKAAVDPDKYVICSVPTNLANWGSTDMIGNVTAVNRGAGEVGFYFTRTNPLIDMGIEVDQAGYPTEELDLAKREALTAKLDGMKVIYTPGSESLLGLSTDFVSFADLNYVTVVTEGVTHDIDVYIQLVEQCVPVFTYREASI